MDPVLTSRAIQLHSLGLNEEQREYVDYMTRLHAVHLGKFGLLFILGEDGSKEVFSKDEPGIIVQFRYAKVN